MQIRNVHAYNIRDAIHAIRNSWNSWGKSDTPYFSDPGCHYIGPEDLQLFLKLMRQTDLSDSGHNYIGPEDLQLCQKLYKAGPSHRKFMRQIMVSMNVVAPLYWWKQFDTYKVGVTSNSCSTMHTLMEHPLAMENFEIGSLEIPYEDGKEIKDVFELYLKAINTLIDRYKEEKKDWIFDRVIQMLPESFLQLRSITMNYEVCATIYEQRKNHKLQEWKLFIDALFTLPYFGAIILDDTQQGTLHEGA